MNESEFIARGWVKKPDGSLSRPARAARVRPRPIQKEQQTDVVHEQADSKMDGGRGGVYRVSVELFISDKRERDGDNGLTTCLDTLCDAVGRFLGLDRKGVRLLATREKRRRGRSDRS